MSNLTLADRYAAIKLQIEALEKELAPIKQEISDNAPVIGQPTKSGWVIEGELFQCSINTQSRKTLDEKALMAKFGLTADQIDSCKKESIFDVIRYKAIA